MPSIRLKRKEITGLFKYLTSLVEDTGHLESDLVLLKNYIKSLKDITTELESFASQIKNHSEVNRGKLNRLLEYIVQKIDEEDAQTATELRREPIIAAVAKQREQEAQYSSASLPQKNIPLETRTTIIPPKAPPTDQPLSQELPDSLKNATTPVPRPQPSRDPSRHRGVMIYISPESSPSDEKEHGADSTHVPRRQLLPTQ